MQREHVLKHALHGTPASQAYVELGLCGAGHRRVTHI
jgi:hypothetical protein